MDNVLITTGYNFERYKIVKYLGVVHSVINIAKCVGPSTFLKIGEEECYQISIDEMMRDLTRRTRALKGNGIIGLQVSKMKDLGTGFGCIVGIATAVQIEKE
ncbi:hypothetical protein [Hominifimenecus sp. rT4P-3]|uniref:hypothetical protein n=1 Tax=Hominifimenecus sp. rT4P-3 TaxID=3242979 RepID=UPI003DA2E6F9